MPDYPLYMSGADISRREAINALKQDFPRFEKAALAMVCNPDDYGVQLTPAAETRLVSAFGYFAGLSIRKPKKKDQRKKANRLYVRLDDAMFARLEEVYSRSSFASKQDLIEAALSDFCNRYGGQ